MSEIIFDLRSADGTILSGGPSVVFSDWRGADECWLYVSPHDDDVVLGAGLIFVAGIELGIKTHVIVSTIGAGYCRAEHRETIGQIRRSECCRSFEMLGLPPSNLHFFDYRATDMLANLGRRFTSDQNCPTAIAGASGFQNSFTWLLRQILPNRVFLPSQTDIHPAHKAVHEEFLISVFHARGKIWPELGNPMTQFPRLYEYATYNDYIEQPTLRVRTSIDLLERKLQGIAAYVSQEQIDLLVATVRNTGPREYIHELIFKLFDPKQYDILFDGNPNE
ncbi:MAG: PIG-L family deacetylase [Planctomycetaceae bacterium]|nr:PIG-L family deacetylase [Planctomycetaceae bacterium]